jgi:hypothetical protein
MYGDLILIHFISGVTKMKKGTLLRSVDKQGKATYFDKYANMARQAAWKVVKAFGYDYEECEAEAFAILIEAVDRFDGSQAGFSTFLHYRLLTVLDKMNLAHGVTAYYDDRKVKGYERHLTQFEIDENGVSYEDLMPDDHDPSREEKFLESFRDKMSGFAFVMLEWVLSREWMTGKTKKPSKNLAIKHFTDWEIEDVSEAWDELASVWGNAVCA